MTKLSFFTLALLTGVGCGVVACSSDGDDTSAAGGKGGSGGATSTGGKGGSTATEAGAGGATSTLYDRLGENEGIAAAVDAIVAKEVQDPDIASYFSQSLDPNYSPSVGDIKECLVLLLDSVSGGPEKYPGKTTSGFTCESMAVAHADLGINSGTFDKFVSIAAAELTSLGVSAADVGIIGGVLNGTESAIVTDTETTDEKPCTAPAACAAAAGAGGTGESAGAGGAG